MLRLTSIISFLFLSHSALADTYHLNDGKILEGTILEDMGDSLRLRVKITRSIYDEKIIKKSDISKTIKVDPSEEAFTKLNKGLPMPDLQTLETYRAKMIDLEKFCLIYPESPHINTAKSHLAELEFELLTVKLGGAKINGELIKAEDIISNQYEHDANVLLAQFKQCLAEGKSRLALDVFIRLNANYINTLPYRTAKPKAQKLLPVYTNTIRQALENSKVLIETRNTKIAKMSSNLRSRTEAVIKQQGALYEQKLAKAKEEGAILMPVNEYRPDILEEVLTQLLELDRTLTRKSAAVEIDAGALYREIYNAIIEKDIKQAANSLRGLHRARIPRQYSIKLITSARELKVTLQEEQREIKRRIKEAKLKERAKNKIK